MKEPLVLSGNPHLWHQAANRKLDCKALLQTVCIREFFERSASDFDVTDISEPVCVCLSQMVTRQGIVERVAKDYQEDNEDPVYINSSNCYRQGDGAPWSRQSSWVASDGLQGNC